MIKLEYVGNKPVITPKGVSFISSKHDKYDYIEPASHLLEELLDLNDETHVLKIAPKNFYGEAKIFQIVQKAIENYEKVFEDAIDAYAKKLDAEKEEVERYSTLQPIEKETLLNNYDFMRKPRLQRATNKIVYENIINESVKLVYKHKITEIHMPFSENFLHVCNSIGSSMEIAYKNVRSDVKVMLDQGTPYSKVFIKYV
jgi:hypothetical protein